MANYRFYFHDSSGHFARAEDVVAASDADALQGAREFGHSHCVEVWQRERKVGMASPVGNVGWLSALAFG